MAQYFEIKKNSTLPSLRVELIDDGTYDFCRRDMYNNAIQNADITFPSCRSVYPDAFCYLSYPDVKGLWIRTSKTYFLCR